MEILLEMLGHPVFVKSHPLTSSNYTNLALEDKVVDTREEENGSFNSHNSYEPESFTNADEEVSIDELSESESANQDEVDGYAWITNDESLRLGVIEEEYVKTLSEDSEGNHLDLNEIKTREEDLIWFIDRRSNRDGYRVQAVCKQVGNTFTVLKGSRISMKLSKHLDRATRKIWKQCLRNRELRADGILLVDVVFYNPSTASNFVIGVLTSGKQTWINRYNQRMDEFLDSDLTESRSMIDDKNIEVDVLPESDSIEKTDITIEENLKDFDNSKDERYTQGCLESEDGEYEESSLGVVEKEDLLDDSSMEDSLEGLELYIYKEDFLKTGKTISAICRVKDGKYIVLAGSYLRQGEAPSFQERCPTECKFRRELETSGMIQKGILMKNIEFNAPSPAAMLVLGRSATGYEEWLTSDGKKLKDIFSKTK